MKTIIVGSSHSNLGKTSLIRSMMSALAEYRVRYVKIGHSKKKSNGHQDYFSSVKSALSDLQKMKNADRPDFLIIESNSAAGKLQADLSIFICGFASLEKTGASRFRKNADILIHPGTPLDKKDIQSKLAVKLQNDLIAAPIIGQQKYLQQKKDPDFTAIILAGGQSSRMGKNKAFLEINGVPQIERLINQILPLTRKIIISTNQPELFKAYPYPTVGDEIRNSGPLAGILAGLNLSETQVNFVTAVDIPELNPDYIRFMLSYAAKYKVVLPYHKRLYEPLFAFYSRNCIEPIKKQLQSGNSKVTGILDYCTVKRIMHKPDRWLINLNTETDFQSYLKTLSKRRKT